MIHNAPFLHLYPSALLVPQMNSISFLLQLSNLRTSPFYIYLVTGTHKITRNVKPIHRIKCNGRHDVEVMGSVVGKTGDNSSEEVRTVVSPPVAVEREGKKE